MANVPKRDRVRAIIGIVNGHFFNKLFIGNVSN